MSTKWSYKSQQIVVVIAITGLLGPLWAEGFVSPSTEAPGPSPQTEKIEKNRKILVEISLSGAQRDDAMAIKEAFEKQAITKIRIKFFTRGHPPENIGIGRDLSAPVARLAIQQALRYNRGIKFLLPSERLAPHYLTFGASIFDELFQIPISAQHLQQLQDPTLTTEQFHALYQRLTGTGINPTPRTP